MTSAHLEDRLLDSASEPYRAAGRFAYHFARGKLRGDPAFGAMLRHGWLRESRRLVDLGCGQGLLLAWLRAAREAHAAGDWPADWPAPPAWESYTGIELRAEDIARGRVASRNASPPGSATFVQGDLRNAALPEGDAFLLFDVLHYLPADSQLSLLARIRECLPTGGLLLARVGDAGAGLRFRLGTWVDRAVMFARRYRDAELHCRAVAEWRAVLTRVGFRSEAVPLSQGTMFANVLLIARAVEHA